MPVDSLSSILNAPGIIRHLEPLFGKHGRVVQIRCRHTRRLRGQAFVSFDSQDSATAAKETLDGHVVFDKPMVLISILSRVKETSFLCLERARGGVSCLTHAGVIFFATGHFLRGVALGCRSQGDEGRRGVPAVFRGKES